MTDKHNHQFSEEAYIRDVARNPKYKGGKRFIKGFKCTCGEFLAQDLAPDAPEDKVINLKASR